MKERIFILLVVLFSAKTVLAQQPSHFVLGEEELSGINVYDLYQDKEDNYWIATNNFIYKYDGYSIRRVECLEMSSSSVFNLVEDYDNNIYCHNLSGQIFQINHDSCFVYFKIPDSLMSHEFAYEFDNTNKLTISTTHLLQVDGKKNVTIIDTNRISSASTIFRKMDSSLVFYNMANHNLTELKHGRIKSKIIEIPITQVPIFLNHNNLVTVYDRKTGLIIRELTTNKDAELPILQDQNNLTRYYSDNSNFWVSNLSGGIHLINKELNATYNSNPFFEHNVVSSFLKDNENNIVLGTFGDGLIIIPNLDMQDIKLMSPTTKVTKLTSSPNGNIFIGTQEGKIYQIDSLNKTTTIIEEGIQQIEILEFLPNLNSLLFNGINENLVNLSNRQAQYIRQRSIKDLYQINRFEYLLATNMGVSIFDSRQISKGINHIKTFEGRAYCIGYDYSTKSIYCGAALGLKIGNVDSVSFFKFNGESVLCRDIIKVDDKMLIASKKHGVLIFKNDKLVDNWNTNKGLLSDNTKIIKEYENKLFLSTDKGLNILNKEGKVLYAINKSNGLNANNIVDFDVVKGALWIVTNKGIQKIDLDKIKNADFYPSINISNIHVNETIIDTSLHLFNHNQKKFVFEITSKSLKYQNDIFYHYQLEGIDGTWVINDYENHIIEYKSLPPSEYTFKVKAVHKMNESETLYYSFSITKPYWQRWWFYLTIIILFLATTFVIFKFQITRQRKKTRLQNQLSLTQLTALKSQMNPHFIFNSLNSIQDLILQQDKENAYNYITKFALLVRKILHQSDKDFIDIEEEVKILTVYLELEELRFKKDFSFTIEANNISDIEIPPMLIQPFVENAIKHGLLHKKGDKYLSISFAISNENLTCIIEDNGIGRQKSSEIKKRQNKTHDSFSVKSITNRFDILKNLYGKDIGVDFEDLIANNEASGTKVILRVPFKRRF